jgi:hypothetical protein
MCEGEGETLIPPQWRREKEGEGREGEGEKVEEGGWRRKRWVEEEEVQVN